VVGKAINAERKKAGGKAERYDAFEARPENQPPQTFGKGSGSRNFDVEMFPKGVAYLKVKKRLGEVAPCGRRHIRQGMEEGVGGSGGEGKVGVRRANDHPLRSVMPESVVAAVPEPEPLADVTTERIGKAPVYQAKRQYVRRV